MQSCTSRTAIIWLALQREMIWETAEEDVAVQRWPFDSTTRTTLAFRVAMAGIAVASWLSYHACGWLTPRMMKGVPLASRSCLPETWNPVAACSPTGTIRFRNNRNENVLLNWPIRHPSRNPVLEMITGLHL